MSNAGFRGRIWSDIRLTPDPRNRKSPSMNEKTAKLLNRYAVARGANVKELKREWNGLDARGRFLRRQELIQDLQGKKKK